VKRRRLNPRSAKRRDQDLRDRAGLEAFALEFGRCWVCGNLDNPFNEFEKLQIHHAVGRTGDERNCRSNLIRACARDHEKFTDNVWRREGLDPKASGVLVCLALKRIHDPRHYDRHWVMGFWRKDLEYLSDADVLREMEQWPKRTSN
jgi:hypothetical protein